MLSNIVEAINRNAYYLDKRKCASTKVIWQNYCSRQDKQC